MTTPLTNLFVRFDASVIMRESTLRTLHSERLEYFFFHRFHLLSPLIRRQNKHIFELVKLNRINYRIYLIRGYRGSVWWDIAEIAVHGSFVLPSSARVTTWRSL